MKKVFLILAAVMFAAVLGSCSKSESGAGNQVTVIFNAMDGVFASGESTLDTIVFAGERIAAPADPVRDGYTFEGWCVDSYGVTPVNFPVLVNTDKIFYAKWKFNPGKWLISGMSLKYRGAATGGVVALLATYNYDENNILTSITCMPPYGYDNLGYSSTRIPLVFKYDGDNVKVTSTRGSWKKETLTVASMKLKDGQCQSMVLDSMDAEMNFTYDAAGRLKSARVDTTNKTFIELDNVNVNDFCYSDFKLKYHDTTEAGKDTTWTTSVSYSNSDIVDITGCINNFNPLFLASLFSNPMRQFSGENKYIVDMLVIPFLFTSPYFETPSAFMPKGFSILGEDPEGGVVGTVMAFDGCSIDPEDGYIRGIYYATPMNEYYITAEFTYVEKK